MICGIDEAGRGSLCGSMFISGVACESNVADWLVTIGIKDSKKLSKSKRFQLADLLKKNEYIHIHTVEKTSKQIDTLGLSRCLKESLEEIIDKLQFFSKEFYMDGNTLFGLSSTNHYQLIPLIKGDDKIPQISAASIIAKTSKDNQMLVLDKIYPQYDFSNNAGYGTKSHLKALEEFGQIDEHRKSFILKKKLF
ncbi:ribonuclease HII [Helicobacter sp. 13S00477-4]|uniref:ribonuclease HII n=1 Tax=Helicobacter sp. 13S00477-4 TaxID=1905759 RepID=UPI000BA55342|nr:ribonuclease HII [Helicobacter sp. 13S00477-4]PAF51926.1 hypothetical protein BKH44_04490 [Helicobacter sp. 13S00477-4]